MSAFEHDRTFPVIARLINEINASSSGWASRDEVVEAMLIDRIGKPIVDTAFRATKHDTPAETAGNRIDWWSKAITEGSNPFAAGYRRIKDSKSRWQYWTIALGPGPDERGRRLKHGVSAAAWLLTCNPKTFDLPQAVSDREGIEAWRLADSYRVDLMLPGDPVVLWVVGPKGSAHQPGVWAVGTVNGTPYYGRGGGGYWLDDDEAQQERPYVPVDLMFLPSPISRDVLQAEPAFKAAEILRLPQGGNPFALTASEYAAIAARVGAVAPPPASPAGDAVPITDSAGERQRVMRSILNRQGQPRFRRKLLAAYGSRCAVTDCDTADALEAAHIGAYAGGGSDEAHNGLLLRADIHTLFDCDLLSIDGALRIHLSPTLSGSHYAGLQGKRIRRPTAQFDRPSAAALNDRHSRVVAKWNSST